MRPLREKSDFVKVLKFNSPKIVIFMAIFAVACTGACQPFFGWTFASMLTCLTTPIDLTQMQLILEGKDPSEWKDNLRDDVVKYSCYILIIAAVIFVGYIGKIYFFSYLGERVTLKIR